MDLNFGETQGATCSGVSERACCSPPSPKPPQRHSLLPRRLLQTRVCSIADPLEELPHFLLGYVSRVTHPLRFYREEPLYSATGEYEPFPFRGE